MEVNDNQLNAIAHRAFCEDANVLVENCLLNKGERSKYEKRYIGWDAGIRPSTKSEDTTKQREQRAKSRGRRSEGFETKDELSDSDLEEQVAAINRACGVSVDSDEQQVFDLTADSDIDNNDQDGEHNNQVHSSSGGSSSSAVEKPVRKRNVAAAAQSGSTKSTQQKSTQKSTSASASPLKRATSAAATKTTKQPASASSETLPTPTADPLTDSKANLSEKMKQSNS